MQEILDVILYILIYGFSTLFILTFLLELQVAFEKQLVAGQTYKLENTVPQNQEKPTVKASLYTNNKRKKTSPLPQICISQKRLILPVKAQSCRQVKVKKLREKAPKPNQLHPQLLLPTKIRNAVQNSIKYSYLAAI
ncbi:MAG: hypothetical protein KME30_13945 [Iphinoe sp. HA4291-MV1]|jgi:ribosomal protein L40E|nr:hypothetical protein [Iphinoe sp. HA4291-MV1]